MECFAVRRYRHIQRLVFMAGLAMGFLSPLLAYGRSIRQRVGDKLCYRQPKRLWLIASRLRCVMHLPNIPQKAWCAGIVTHHRRLTEEGIPHTTPACIESEGTTVRSELKMPTGPILFVRKRKNSDRLPTKSSDHTPSSSATAIYAKQEPNSWKLQSGLLLV